MAKNKQGRGMKVNGRALREITTSRGVPVRIGAVEMPLDEAQPWPLHSKKGMRAHKDADLAGTIRCRWHDSLGYVRVSLELDEAVWYLGRLTKHVSFRADNLVFEGVAA